MKSNPRFYKHTHRAHKIW